LNLEPFYPELKNHVLVCATEMTAKSAIDRMADVYRRFHTSSTATAPWAQKDFATKSSGL
jgi:hypothetical protein